MIVNLELPKDVLKLAEEQGLLKKWSRKLYLEQTIIEIVRQRELELKAGGKGK